MQYVQSDTFHKLPPSPSKWPHLTDCTQFRDIVANACVVLTLAVKICPVTSVICRAVLVWLMETSSVGALESIPRPCAACSILGNIETWQVVFGRLDSHSHQAALCRFLMGAVETGIPPGATERLLNNRKWQEADGPHLFACHAVRDNAT